MINKKVPKLDPINSLLIQNFMFRSAHTTGNSPIV